MANYEREYPGYGRQHHGHERGRPDYDWEHSERDWGRYDFDRDHEHQGSGGYGREYRGRDWEQGGYGVYGGEHQGYPWREEQGGYGRMGRGREWEHGGYGAIGGYGREQQGYGPYAGRGPKGYQRSDARIYEDICERLTQHPAIDASEIEIEVNSGEVTLRGTVDSRAVKHLAENMVETISGVKDVHNQIRVSSSQQQAGSMLGQQGGQAFAQGGQMQESQRGQKR